VVEKPAEIKMMEGSEQTLYNKLLFRKSSFEEAKSEILKRNIICSPSDTTYILTLRLRKDILEKAEIQSDVVQTIEKELLEYEKRRRRPGDKYNCCLPGCKFSCSVYGKYISHLDLVHHHSSSKFICQHRHLCTREFQSVEMLRSHIKGVHEKRITSVEIAQNQLVEQLTKLKCCVSGCGHSIFSSINLLKKHLQTHTDRKEEVQCVFCAFCTDTTGTLKSHMSRKHKVQTVDHLNPKLVIESPEDCEPVTESSSGELASTTSQDFEIEQTSDSFEEEAEDDDSVDDSEEIFLRAIAIMVSYNWYEI
jgi:hypothetical protein